MNSTRAPEIVAEFWMPHLKAEYMTPDARLQKAKKNIDGANALYKAAEDWLLSCSYCYQPQPLMEEHAKFLNEAGRPAEAESVRKRIREYVEKPKQKRKKFENWYAE